MFDRFPPPFRDRSHAGRKLAERLGQYRGDAVVMAVPRGGIPVAIEIAGKLKADLDVVITRKIPIPQEPEAGYGAVTEDGTIVLNEPLVRQLGFSQKQIMLQAEAVRKDIDQRIIFFRKYLPKISVEGRSAIIVDDGLASGFTMIAAIESIKARQPDRIVVAVPAASEKAYDLVKTKVDDLIYLSIGRGPFFAVASYYANWYDLKDEDVQYLIKDWQTAGSLSRKALTRKD